MSTTGVTDTDTRLDRGRTPLATVAVAAIRLYQVARSGHPSPCRFTPTCSQYALEAVERHGTRRGLWLAARRLGRCRPGGPFGYDPVPDLTVPDPALPDLTEPE